jgi:hypothetical protein
MGRKTKGLSETAGLPKYRMVDISATRFFLTDILWEGVAATQANAV